MAIPISVVDAFTTKRFSGNPAAVCFPAGDEDAQWMQSMAAEMNLAETAFVRPHPEGYNLRWFTPAVEIDLCGHATLASAHVLWESGRLNTDTPARFFTKSGWLICRRKGGGIEMDFPAVPVTPGPVPAPVLAALGLTAADVVFSGRTPSSHLVRVPKEAQVRALKPDFGKLGQDALGRVIVTAQGTSGGAFDFVSRFFAPSAGINEDPVTGSAHCALAPYWAKELGKAEMTAYQASPRGGTLTLRPQGDRVFLGGTAVTVWRGELA